MDVPGLERGVRDQHNNDSPRQGPSHNQSTQRSQNVNSNSNQSVIQPYQNNLGNAQVQRPIVNQYRPHLPLSRSSYSNSFPIRLSIRQPSRPVPYVVLPHVQNATEGESHQNFSQNIPQINETSDNGNQASQIIHNNEVSNDFHSSNEGIDFNNNGPDINYDTPESLSPNLDDQQLYHARSYNEYLNNQFFPPPVVNQGFTFYPYNQPSTSNSQPLYYNNQPFPSYPYNQPSISNTQPLYNAPFNNQPFASSNLPFANQRPYLHIQPPTLNGPGGYYRELSYRRSYHILNPEQYNVQNHGRTQINGLRQENYRFNLRPSYYQPYFPNPPRGFFHQVYPYGHPLFGTHELDSIGAAIMPGFIRDGILHGLPYSITFERPDPYYLGYFVISVEIGRYYADGNWIRNTIEWYVPRLPSIGDMI